jgi:hypothetical protein
VRVPGRPCSNCPWRRDVPAGEFPMERYEALRECAGEGPGREAGLDAPVFACHKSRDGGEFPCAGYLAAVGRSSLRVRMLAAYGLIPAEALDPGEDWPALFETYEEMMEVQAG